MPRSWSAIDPDLKYRPAPPPLLSTKPAACISIVVCFLIIVIKYNVELDDAE